MAENGSGKSQSGRSHSHPLISQIRDDFDRAWLQGPTPNLREWLQRHPDLYAELAPELLEIDCHRRSLRPQDSQPGPHPDDYADFPRDWVDQAFAQLAGTTVLCEADQALAEGDRPSLCERDQNDPTLPLKIDHYKVCRRLGKGGFGEVFLAEDSGLRRLVAIKIPTALARLKLGDEWLREARIVAQLSHPHIVPVHHIGSTPEFPAYIVSRYIDGPDLARHLHQRITHKQGLLPLAEAVRLIRDAADALDYAHRSREGLVHRDIKPANLLLDSQGTIHVTDFGIALRDVEVGRNNPYFGTLAYMSPEQANGEGHRVDGRSDVFSLGVVLYELLVGRRPFEGETDDELYKNIQHCKPKPPRARNVTVPIRLDEICRKALARLADDRYITAGDFRDDLDDCLNRILSFPSPVATPLGGLAGGMMPSNTPVAPFGTVVTPSAGATPVTPPPGPAVPPRVIPKGLRSYDAQDAEFFLQLVPGPRDRNGLPESLRFWKQQIEQFDSQATFWVGLLYGPSGCGKSSLVKAGLLPHLDSRIDVVFLEATTDDTESRLLARLGKTFPPLAGLSLVDTLKRLRQQHPLAEGRKVLLVIDQFEQWLYSHLGQESGELTQALRHCDGERLQALLLVRDDFAMSAMRFQKELGNPQGGQLWVYDLFDTDHAAQVLTAFGEAYRKLPDNPADLAPAQQAFVAEAIAGLARNHRVICVQLALFAEMFKNRPWTIEALHEVGGISGVGVTFLEETFSAKHAPPRQRYHERGARQVLRALLPEVGSEIKGESRTVDELQQAAGYAARPADFAELLRLLDTDLRLITPVEGPELSSDETALSADVPAPVATARFQLTHDYLVPALREWLTQKQAETPAGRAELLLAERAALWTSKPEDRHLPTFLEHLRIRRLTRATRRSASEQRLLRRAALVHGRRLGWAGLVAVLLALGAGWLWQDRRQREAVAQIDRLESAVAGEWGRVFDELQTRGLQSLAEGPLRERLAAAQTEGKPQQEVKLRAGLLATGGDAAQVEPLARALLTLPVAEFAVVRELLASHAGPKVTTTLWDRATDQQNAPAQQRFQAAAALAQFAPDEPRWPGLAPFVARHLASLPAADLVAWRPLLEPVRDALAPAVADLVIEPNLEPLVRRSAAETLADYGRDMGTVLAEALLQSDPQTFAVLLEVATRNHDQVAARLQQELARSEAPPWPETPMDPSWQPVTDSATRRIREAAGHVDERWAFCLRLPLDEVRAFCEELRPTGYRPVRLWSWKESERVFTALIWQRDGAPWQLAGPLEPAELVATDTRYRQQSLCPVALDFVQRAPVKALGLWGPSENPSAGVAHTVEAPRFERDRGTALPGRWHLELFRVEPETDDPLPNIDALAEQKPFFDLDVPDFADKGLHLDAARDLPFQRSVLVFQSEVTVPTSGQYQLWIRSSDPVRVLIDDHIQEDHWQSRDGKEVVVDSDVALSAGAHQVRVVAFHDKGPVALDVALGWVSVQLQGTASASAPGQTEGMTMMLAGGKTPEELQTRVLEAVRGGFRPTDFQEPNGDVETLPGFDILCRKPKLIEEEDLKRIRRMAQAAAGLACLEERDAELVWPLLKFTPVDEDVTTQDPTLRTEVLHTLAEYRVPVEVIVRRIEHELRVGPSERNPASNSILQGLIKALGGYAPQLSASERRQIVQRLDCQSLYELEPEAGLHGALEWLLRIWGEEDFLQESLVRLSGKRLRPPAPQANETRRWFVNKQGQTFVVFPQGIFTMGSPADERGRIEVNEPQHRRRIERSFAIASTEVTRAQYAVFAKAEGIEQRETPYSKTADDPQTRVTWYNAVRYCNWLSQAEGLQACYRIRGSGDKPTVTMEPNFLDRNGYRLPTEAEWEYAFRAGVGVAWGHGRAERRLGQYAWFLKTSDDHLWPAGRLLPNEAGLFDMSGNSLEWCQEAGDLYPQEPGEHATLLDDATTVDANTNRVLRGGSFGDSSTVVRAAVRNGFRPDVDYSYVGFRPSRTYP